METLRLIFPFLLVLSNLVGSNEIPYAGKIAIQGVNYDGEAKFSFSLIDDKGATHWRNGNSRSDSIKVTVRNGRYSVLLGGQGMHPLTPELFLTQDKLYLKVEFDNGDGRGLRHLAPDQLITSTPKALVADVARVANSVKSGSVTSQMLASDAGNK